MRRSRWSPRRGSSSRWRSPTRSRPSTSSSPSQGADEASARGRVAGCVFVGSGGATAFGDYAAGSNHVLPTGGAARFGGPLGPGAFMRRTSVVHRRLGGGAELAPHVAALAEAEGFPVHGESALARAEDDDR